MNFTQNDNPLLVAPRPVRLTSAHVFARTQPVRLVSAPTDQFERVKITDDDGIDDLKVGLFCDSTTGSSLSDKDLASPRASPRLTLPSEALEEFLSILRPSFFPPTSPIYRSRRQSSLPSFNHERSHSFKSRGRFDLRNDPNGLLGFEEIDRVRSTQPSRNASRTPDSPGEGAIEFDVIDSEGHPIRWYTSNALSSPISRMNTRNPFQRHPSYDLRLPSPACLSPAPMSPLSSHLSPSAIPLPLPTPDEFIEFS